MIISDLSYLELVPEGPRVIGGVTVRETDTDINSDTLSQSTVNDSKTLSEADLKALTGLISALQGLNLM